MIVSIPLLSNAQSLSVVLRGVTYQLTLTYNTREGYWTMSIQQEGETLVNGVALVGGVDIVEQYTFELKDLWVVNLSDTDANATGNNLGVDVLLVQVDDADVINFTNGEGAGVIAAILT